MSTDETPCLTGRQSSHMESGTMVAVCMCGRFFLFLFCFESASENSVCRAIAQEEVRHYSKVCRGSERMYSVCVCKNKICETLSTTHLNSTVKIKQFQEDISRTVQN